MNREKGFSLGEIAKARPNLMGLATLWIALFHSLRLNFYQPWLLAHPHLMDILNRLREEGNCGVDIFLFLSGFGLVYSWTRLKERDPRPLRTFYRRRFSRVLPTMLAVFVLYYGIAGTRGTADWLSKVFLYGQFSATLEGGNYWFFALLLALYLLFPLIWKVVDRFGLPGTLGLIALAVLGPLAVKRFISESYFVKTEILLTRIPVFILGVCFGKLARRDARIPRWIPALALVLALVTWYEIRLIPEELLYLRRYAYAFLTLFIVLAHAWLSSLVSKKGPLYRAVTRIGAYSLELYLIYERLYLANPLGIHSPDAIGIIYALTWFTAALLLSALLRSALRQLGDREPSPVS